MNTAIHKAIDPSLKIWSRERSRLKSRMPHWKRIFRTMLDYINPVYFNPLRKIPDSFGEGISDSPARSLANPHLMHRTIIDYIMAERHLYNALTAHGPGEYMVVASVIDSSLRLTVHPVISQHDGGKQVYNKNWVREGSPRFILTMDNRHNGSIEPIRGNRWRWYSADDSMISVIEKQLDENTFKAWTGTK